MTVAAVAEATTAVEATTVTEGMTVTEVTAVTTAVEATTMVAAGTIAATIAAVEAWELATKAGEVATLTVREIQLGAKTGVLIER